MKSSFCIDLQRFMLIPTKFPLSRSNCTIANYKMLNSKQKKPTQQFVGELIKILRNIRDVFRECSLP